jgi:ABC-type phosphate/phosphonate transport system substrate-binding protein
MILASLPMYDWPEVREHTNALWRAFSKHAGISGELNRTTFYSDVWKHPELFFSQTCGYPFTHKFKGLLNYVATPHYTSDGCDGAHYCSIIFSRELKPLDEFYGSVLAMNTLDSLSGMLAAKLVFAPFIKGGEFFKRTKITGGHRNSLAAVRSRYADICAIDSVCVELAKRYCPQELEGLVEVARSPMMPSLPFVTGASDIQLLREALQKTFLDKNLKSNRQALLLQDYSIMPDDAYDKITEMENALPPFNL